MADVSFVPNLAEGDAAEFEGSLVLRRPNFDEKYSYIEQCQFSTDSAQSDQLKSIRQMVKISEPHYVKVDLKHKETGKKYKSFADLSENDECHPILVEVAGKILSGFGMGKK